jgi:hypothetical protein
VGNDRKVAAAGHRFGQLAGGGPGGGGIGAHGASLPGSRPRTSKY